MPKSTPTPVLAAAALLPLLLLLLLLLQLAPAADAARAAYPLLGRSLASTPFTCPSGPITSEDGQVFAQTFSCVDAAATGNCRAEGSCECSTTDGSQSGQLSNSIVAELGCPAGFAQCAKLDYNTADPSANVMTCTLDSEQYQVSAQRQVRWLVA
jgi:hypothetical protein